VSSLELLAFAVVLVLFGFVLVRAARESGRRARLVAAVRTTRIGDLDRVPSGRLVEVKGRLRCGEPLIADISKRRCAYHHSLVERGYKDSDGDDRWETARETELFANFQVQDRTGTVWVDPESAEFDALPVVVRRVERSSGSGGRFTFSIGGVSIGGRRTTAFRYTEHILPVGAPVYVVGILGSDRAIRAPRDPRNQARMLISHRREESILEALRSRAMLSSIGAPLCFLGAVVLIVFACR
jgi:hypothetical protein